jgi:transposase
MNTAYLGIDISKDKFDAALLHEDRVDHATFTNNCAGYRQLLRWRQKLCRLHLHVAMEATGQYGLPLAEFLYAASIDVSVVNPMLIHYYARTRLTRNKTDQHDAELIAAYCQQHQPRLWHPRRADLQSIHELIRAREQMSETRVRTASHLEQAPSSVASCFRRQLALLDRQLKALEKQITQCVKENPQLRQDVELLSSIDGIGQLTACTVLSIIPAVDELQSARQLAAFAGVTPHQHQSGASSGKTTMSKFGHHRLRKALYWPAITALRTNKRAQDLASRLGQKGKCKMVIIGAVMRLLCHLIYGVLRTRKMFDPNYHSASLAS